MPAGRMYTGGTTSPAPTVSQGWASSYDNQYNYGISLPEYNNVPSETALYNGSLSAHGNMVAMQVNRGGPKLGYAGTDEFGAPVYTALPWLTGYAREYWRDPSQTTLGANSAIPAITGVMPERFADLPGNFNYYVDLQLSRISGSNYFNNYSFINNFNQALNWVLSSNSYIVALKKAEDQNLAYFNVKSYQELISQGFSNYQIGTALRRALSRVGTYVTQLPSGYFGTSNSVASLLIDSGLGAIGNLTTKLSSAGVNLSDIYNPTFSPQITEVLGTITNKSDLITIQEVLGSSVPNITSPNDFTDIAKVAGISNDSLYQNFVDFGKDLYNRAPNLNVGTGQELVDLINLVLAEAGPGVETLATPTGILPAEVIAGLRYYLPYSANNQPVSILNIIGCASGYLTDKMQEVNRCIDTIDKSQFGTQIHSALSTINSTYPAYAQAIAPQYDSEGYPLPAPTTVAAATLAYQNAVNNYYSVLNQVKNDPSLKSTVDRLNVTYDSMCESIYYEVKNYNKANTSVSTFYDNTVVSSFVNSLGSYAVDSQNVGTDYFLYGMCQDNRSGQIVRTLMDQYKNFQILANAGIRITGIL